MASLSFGSFGDIITACQIAIELSQALSTSRGSAKEYHDLKKELEGFVTVLRLVIQTYQQFEQSTSLRELADATKSIVDDSMTLIHGALYAWSKKYGDSFRDGGSGNRFKDAFKKVKWLGEKNGVVKLQEKLKAYTIRLNGLATLIAQESGHVDNATLICRVNEVKDTMESRQIQTLEAIKKQNDILVSMRGSLNSQNAGVMSLGAQKTQTNDAIKSVDYKLSVTNDLLKRQGETISTALRSLEFVKGILEGLCKLVTDQQSKMTNSRFLTGPDPTLGKDITINDALGGVIAFNPDLIHSWTFFEAFLAHQFEGRRGHNMVVQQHYALEESCSGKDINRKIPWEMAVRRGMHIDMSVVFVGFPLRGECCPRCQTKTYESERASIQCPKQNCGMWFRVMKMAEANVRPHAHQSQGKRDLRTNSGGDGLSNPGFLKDPFAVEPSDFQRVRLIIEERLPTQQGPHLRGVVSIEYRPDFQSLWDLDLRLDVYDQSLPPNAHRRATVFGLSGPKLHQFKNGSRKLKPNPHQLDPRSHFNGLQVKSGRNKKGTIVIPLLDTAKPGVICW